MVSKAFEPGAVLRVDLDADQHGYARMLTRPSRYAFFDGRDREPAADLAEIVHRPVLFVIAVSEKAVKRWPKVGVLPPDVAPVPLPDQFMQDIATGQCEIVDEAFNSRPATPEECAGLERVAVWSPEDVEERLRDHYADRPNKHLSYMRVQG